MKDKEGKKNERILRRRKGTMTMKGVGGAEGRRPSRTFVN